MKPIKITCKNSFPRYINGKGVEYRVMFSDIPEYIKKQWMQYAKGICPKEEMKNPQIEMKAILHKDKTLENVEVRYYFDNYQSFSLNENDYKEICKLFIEFVMKNRKGLPDAYDPRTDELMGDGEWLQKAEEVKNNIIPNICR